MSKKRSPPTDRFAALKKPKNCFDNPHRDLDWMLHHAKKHKDCNKIFIQTILKQDKVLIDNQATAESRKLYRMAREVAGDTHRTLAFLRFDISKHGILHAKINLKHHTEFRILRRFAHRFPLFVIILQSKRGCFVAKHNEYAYHDKRKLDKVLPEFEKKLPIHELLDGMDNNDFQRTVWKEFYATQYIPTRRNTKLMLKHMPKKFLNNTDKYEAVFYKGCKDLREFIP